ncbi:hypothetical protein [Puia dinghuensis]|uniref:ATP synthase YMF19-like N-terminal domain-containing protein n=1 Tax=Puia dinghuensis TaxID=1792502 RepID=A0A8J2UGB8_9BACT|nr:hypothetical protein [Puia dinghuensis]GGB11748.1 hypothetical protein GCM10011511_39240 [Puia dinghuensis]
MALSEIFFLAIVFYLLYRFVFHFLVPVAKTTRIVRQQFRNMQQQATQREQPKEPEQPAKNQSVGEYIDFEEVK